MHTTYDRFYSTCCYCIKAVCYGSGVSEGEDGGIEGESSSSWSDSGGSKCKLEVVLNLLVDGIASRIDRECLAMTLSNEHDKEGGDKDVMRLHVLNIMISNCEL